MVGKKKNNNMIFIVIFLVIISSCYSICSLSSSSSGYYYLQNSDSSVDTNKENAFGIGDNGESYKGKQNKTIYGETCRKWSDPLNRSEIKSIYSQNKTKYDLDSGTGNYCRNPGGKQSTIWCPTSSGIQFCTPLWQPTCSSQIKSLSGDKGSDYRGLQNTTHDGNTCDNWTSVVKGQEKLQKYPNSGLVSNYCRNPDGTGGIWCYINGGSNWKHCNPKKC